MNFSIFKFQWLFVLLTLVPLPVSAKEYDWNTLTPAKDGTDWRYFYEAVSLVPKLDDSLGVVPYRFTVRRRMSATDLKPWDLVFRFGYILEKYAPIKTVNLSYDTDRFFAFSAKSVRLTQTGDRVNQPGDKVGLYEVSISLSNDEMRFLKTVSSNYENMVAYMVIPGHEIQLPWDYGQILERAWLGTEKITNPEVTYASHFTIQKFYHPSLGRK